MIKKSVFPSEIVPLSIFLSGLTSHLLALGLLIVAAAVWTGVLAPTLLLLPVYLVLLGFLSLGLGWILAGLHVYLGELWVYFLGLFWLVVYSGLVFASLVFDRPDDLP